MSDQYLAVVMSDLHLGEEDSIMMGFEDGGVFFDEEIANKVKELVKATLKQDKVQYLILNGDVLELSLATRVQAFRSFRAFLNVFSDLCEMVIYIPGNHDHHIWIALQEEARIFAQIRKGEDVRQYYNAFIPAIYSDKIELPTIKEPSKPYGKQTFLYSLLPETAQANGMSFLVAYPNLHVNLERKVLITHGHFFEDTWRLFSDAIPNSLKLSQLSYKSLQQINSPFIEFGWYHLGQAGKLSALLEDLWDEVHSGRHEKADKVVDEIGHYLDGRLEFRPKNKKGFKAFINDIMGRHVKEFASDQAIELCMTIMKKLILSQISTETPDTPGSPLRHAVDMFTDPRKKSKIKDYLEIGFIDDEFDLDFLVFGHTHRPITQSTPEQIGITIGGKQVVAYNTGGWVTDVMEPEHLRQSRPAVFAIDQRGSVKNIEIPWPRKLDFDQVIEEYKETAQRKKKIKEEVKKNL